MEEINLETLDLPKGKVLAEKVKYGPGQPDPQDTTNEAFRILRVAEDYKDSYFPKIKCGDLASMSHRIRGEKTINRKLYYVLDTSQIDYLISKENVEESLLG